jgi:hypothetical protein
MATVVTALFFLSGMVALAYEVVWVRALGLVVGNSLWAAVAVVAAYMGGMAIGSALVARYVRRVRRHVRLYGLAEAVAAVVALATAPALHVLQRLAAGLGPEPLAGWGLPLLARFSLAWAFLALPTVAMGATLPLLVARVGQQNALARRVGRLYAANTFGAVAGVVLAGFFACRSWGAGTLASSRRSGCWSPAWRGSSSPAVPLPQAAADGAHAARWWLLTPRCSASWRWRASWSGPASCSWHLGSRVYAFALILAVYLAGIAIGAALARLRVHTEACAGGVSDRGCTPALQIPCFPVRRRPRLDRLPRQAAHLCRAALGGSRSRSQR